MPSLNPVDKNKKKDCRKGKSDGLNWPVPDNFSYWFFLSKQGDSEVDDSGQCAKNW